MMPPEISIIMPSFNSEKTIARAIDSIINQTFTNWQLIIIDDNSSDNTSQIIKKYELEDGRISYVINDKNYGSGYSRNCGIKISTGKYLAFLDSDDMWLPHKLNNQYKMMINEGVDFSCSEYFVVNDLGSNGNSVFKRISIPYNKITYQKLISHNLICTSTVIVSKSILGDKLMPDIRRRQDYAMWLSILKEGHSCYILNDANTVYTSSLNVLKNGLFKAFIDHLKFLKKSQKISVLFAFVYTLSWVKNGILKRI